MQSTQTMHDVQENAGETELRDKYISRAERMVSRWAGIRGPSRPCVVPKENVSSRRDEDYEEEKPAKVAAVQSSTVELQDTNVRI